MCPARGQHHPLINHIPHPARSWHQFFLWSILIGKLEPSKWSLFVWLVGFVVEKERGACMYIDSVMEAFTGMKETKIQLPDLNRA